MENVNNVKQPNTGIITEDMLVAIRKLKGIIQKAIIWTLVGGVICGALFILMGDLDNGSVIIKFMGTLFLLGGSALISLVNFAKIESKNSTVQLISVVGIIANVCWTILWTLAIWGAFDVWSYCRVACTSRYSFLGLLAFISSHVSSFCIFGSIILDFYEGGKSSIIRPLKLTSFSCLAFTSIHSIVMLFTNGYSMGDTFLLRLGILSAFASFVWVVTALIALIISAREKNAIEYTKRKEESKKQQEILAKAAENVSMSSKESAPKKTDDDLRAEIEEKVRRELIEKEVREKLEKEMAEKKTNE